MPYKNLIITPPQNSNQDATKQSQFYRGFSTVNNKSKAVSLYDAELIKQDLMNQFSTRKGERLMNPEFGTIIWSIIFDPLTDVLKQDITDDVERILSNDPRLSPIKVMVIEQDYGILIEATVTYENSNQVDNLRINFDKELGLPTIQ